MQFKQLPCRNSTEQSVGNEPLPLYADADYLNDAGNMLSVSANTMAKLNHASFDWLDNIEGKIEEFENRGGTAQEI